MFRFALILVAVVCVTRARANPTGCTEDEHCPSGSYCAVEQLFCRQCLRCEDLKREEPRGDTSCVMSAIQCGPCFKGLTEGKLGHALQCVSAEPLAEESSWGRGWVAGMAALLVVAILLCITAAIVLRNFKAYKLVSATGTMAGSPADCDGLAATAPPPPYNAAMAVLPQTDSRVLIDESAPFIKPVPLSRVAGAREAAGTQAARVFNDPDYARAGAMPPTYEAVARSDELNLNENPPPVRGDDFVDNSSRAIAVAASMEPGASSTTQSPVEAYVTAAATSPAKALGARQDSNNNSADSAAADGSSSCNPSFLAHNSSPFIINVIKNITTVQQHNDVTL